MTKVATASWREGLHFSAMLPSGVTLEMGSDSDNSGPRPKELLLGALLGCTGMDVVAIMEKMRAPFNGLTLKVEAEEHETHPKVFDVIRVMYSLDGPESSREAFERAVELSWTKYCPVAATLKTAGSLSYRTDVNGVPGREGA